MIGGYENPVQTMPSGEGNFCFETSDPGTIDSFYALNADRRSPPPPLWQPEPIP